MSCTTIHNYFKELMEATQSMGEDKEDWMRVSSLYAKLLDVSTIASCIQTSDFLKYNLSLIYNLEVKTVKMILDTLL